MSPDPVVNTTPDPKPTLFSAVLGHASPTVTLSTYAHMMPVDEDRARSVIATAMRSRVSILCPEGTNG
jgi:hypothetical protein